MAEVVRCHHCRVAEADAFGDVAWPVWCPDCEGKYSNPLLKATVDEFDYAAKLRTGEVVRFAAANIRGEWVDLRGHGEQDRPVEGLAHPCPRSVSVRLSDIVWVADAPDGS